MGIVNIPFNNGRIKAHNLYGPARAAGMSSGLLPTVSQLPPFAEHRVVEVRYYLICIVKLYCLVPN